MLGIFRTSGFKSDFKKLSIDDKEKLKVLLVHLIQSKILEQKYKNHPLAGSYNGCLECHIKPDLLLIYKIDNELSELQLVRVGSHSQLFKK
jgi:mRNA interferase YafQ